MSKEKSYISFYLVRGLNFPLYQDGQSFPLIVDSLSRDLRKAKPNTGMWFQDLPELDFASRPKYKLCSVILTRVFNAHSIRGWMVIEGALKNYESYQVDVKNGTDYEVTFKKGTKSAYDSEVSVYFEEAECEDWKFVRSLGKGNGVLQIDAKELMIQKLRQDVVKLKDALEMSTLLMGNLDAMSHELFGGEEPVELKEKAEVNENLEHIQQCFGKIYDRLTTAQELKLFKNEEEEEIGRNPRQRDESREREKADDNSSSYSIIKKLIEKETSLRNDTPRRSNRKTSRKTDQKPITIE